MVTSTGAYLIRVVDGAAPIFWQLDKCPFSPLQKKKPTHVHNNTHIIIVVIIIIIIIAVAAEESLYHLS